MLNAKNNKRTVIEASSIAASSCEFHQIYQREFDWVWVQLHRLGVEQSVLEDATQDVFLVVHRRIAKFEGRSSMRTWLYAILRRVAMHYMRDRYRLRRRKAALKIHQETVRLVSMSSSVVEGSTGLDHQCEFERAMERCDAIEVLSFFLDSLEPLDREIFVLADIQGLTRQRIAQLTNMRPSTAYSRLRKVRSQFESLCAEPRDVEIMLGQARSNPSRPPVEAKSRVWSILMVPTSFTVDPISYPSLESLAATSKVGISASSIVLPAYGKWLVIGSVLAITGAIVPIHADSNTARTAMDPSMLAKPNDSLSRSKDRPINDDDLADLELSRLEAVEDSNLGTARSKSLHEIKGSETANATPIQPVPDRIRKNAKARTILASRGQSSIPQSSLAPSGAKSIQSRDVESRTDSFDPIGVAQEFARVMKDLRTTHRPNEALARLDVLQHRNLSNEFRNYAITLRLEALCALGQRDEAFSYAQNKSVADSKSTIARRQRAILRNCRSTSSRKFVKGQVSGN